MKSEEKVAGSVKRFGARYGRKPKLKFSKIEAEHRKLHKCPYCSRIAVKRVAVGIWHCKKCNARFTGKAYSITRDILQETKEIVEEEQPVINEKVDEAEMASGEE